MSDLTDLFAKDPLSLTRQDIRAIVEDLRKKRAQFNLGNVKAGSTKPLTEKQKEVNSLNVELDL